MFLVAMVCTLVNFSPYAFAKLLTIAVVRLLFHIFKVVNYRKVIGRDDGHGRRTTQIQVVYVVYNRICDVVIDPGPMLPAEPGGMRVALRNL